VSIFFSGRGYTVKLLFASMASDCGTTTPSSSSSSSLTGPRAPAVQTPDLRPCYRHLAGSCGRSDCPRPHVPDPGAVRAALAEQWCPEDGICRLRICPHRHMHPPETVPPPPNRLPVTDFVPPPPADSPQGIDEAFTFRPIGHARCCYHEKHGCPRQTGLVPSSWATIELCRGSQFAQAVDGLEQFSHIWLIFVFNRAHDRGAAWHPCIETPRETQMAKVGVFACRAPDRPNPIGLSVVALEKVTRVQGKPVTLHVRGIDLLDNTPILDIKPYIPYADRVDAATTGWIRDEVPHWPVHLDDGVVVPPDLEVLLPQTLRIDPRPVPQKKRWPVGDPESERRAFAFRLEAFSSDYKSRVRMESEEDIIERDRKSHPRCGYSISQSESCSSQNGNKMECEITKRIIRNCRGEPPFAIFNKVETSSGDHTMRSDGFGLFPGMSSQDDSLDAFKNMGSLLDQFMKGSNDETSQPHYRPHVKPPPIPQLPPHYPQPDRQKKEQQRKGGQGGYISGSIEEI